MMSASPKDQQEEAGERQQSIDELDEPEPQPEAENEGGKRFFPLARTSLISILRGAPSLFTSP